MDKQPAQIADAAALLTALTDVGVPVVEIGEVLPPGKPLIEVVRVIRCQASSKAQASLNENGLIETFSNCSSL